MPSERVWTISQPGRGRGLEADGPAPDDSEWRDGNYPEPIEVVPLSDLQAAEERAERLHARADAAETAVRNMGYRQNDPDQALIERITELEGALERARMELLDTAQVLGSKGIYPFVEADLRETADIAREALATPQPREGHHPPTEGDWHQAAIRAAERIATLEGAARLLISQKDESNADWASALSNLEAALGSAPQPQMWQPVDKCPNDELVRPTQPSEGEEGTDGLN